MEKSPAPALTNGLEIIELIAEKGEVGFNSISEIKGISVSSLNRILKVLLSKSYIVKNDKGKYMLGSRIFTLAKSESLWNGILKRASNILKEISEKYEATALLFGFSDESVIALDKVINIDSVVMQKVGTVSKQFLNRPWGFVYMASVSAESRKKFYEIVKNSENDSRETPSHEEVEEFIEFAKREGYSDDFGKIKSSIRRLAVPIVNSKGEVISALAVGFVNGALSEETIEEIISYLKNKAVELNNLISQ
ncbi:IclR family transcriptional regulator domain-containing protein [Oceanirhabdus sp. W0125-5]|uniref:IclR family transcriptional regulator domain-containing protein n=1 Tax=Oceanirhabdus sp. W0125-5 TaxID=2999116 RepID=UPI0022F2EF35|nr:IclR family transcriptional regulator C-terminal domain-containing protein [Oceanirhabdus sp. W0125-5]WBW99091.1 IclR family transcriptional regulator C-terminal domain-containing protein [Oceanirhabdus sp. W0125-5]